MNQYANGNQPQQPPYQAPQPYYPPEPNRQEPPKRDKTGIIIAVIAAIVAIALIIVGVVLIVGMKRDKEPDFSKADFTRDPARSGEVWWKKTEANTTIREPETEAPAPPTQPATETPTEVQTEVKTEAKTEAPPATVPVETEAPDDPDYPDDTKYLEFLDQAKRDIPAILDPLKGEYGYYFMDLKYRAAVYGGDTDIPSASTIKIIIMARIYQLAEDGLIDLDTEITVPKDKIVGGTGKIHTENGPYVYSIEDLVNYMMRYSDNTAGNMLIDLAGGLDALNEYAAEVGCGDTHFGRYFMQEATYPEGDNRTSAIDLANMLEMIWRGDCVSPRSDKAMLEIMKQSEEPFLLGDVLSPSDRVYHKSGNLPGCLHDAAIVETGDSAYIFVIMTKDGDRDQQLKLMKEAGNYIYGSIPSY